MEFLPCRGADGWFLQFGDLHQRLEEVGGRPVLSLLHRSIQLLSHIGPAEIPSARVEPVGRTRESSRLLQRQCATLALSVRDLCRTKLYETHWKNVDVIWRQTYTISAAILAVATMHEVEHCSEGDVQRCLQVLDLGLLLGAPVTGVRLVDFAQRLQTLLFATNVSKSALHVPDPVHALLQMDTSGQKENANEDVGVHLIGTKPDGHRCTYSEPNAADATANAPTNAVDDNLRPSKILRRVQDGDDASSSSCTSEARGPSKMKSGYSYNTPVVTLNCPSLMEFEEKCVRAQTPCVIRGAMGHWPALTKWKDFNYLRNLAGGRTVPVEQGSSYVSESWSQTLMTLADFLDSFGSSTEDGDKATSKAYLAQHELFDQIPALAEDIATPDYCCIGDEGDIRQTNAWLGPAGTVSPLHHDPYRNLLCQVVGRKRVRLYAPQHSAALYPHPDALLCNTSQVDLENPDHGRFPSFADAPPSLDCVLVPGDMLYIPPKWWHHVRSLSPSFSVSFWWL